MVEVFGIAAAHFEQVVLVAGDVVAFADLVDLFDATEERCALAMAGQQDGNVSSERIANRGGIEQGRVAADDALLFEFASAFGGGRRGQAEGLAEFSPGGAAVARQKVEGLVIQGVEVVVLTKRWS